MVSNTCKLRSLLPKAPRKRFNVYSGTNTMRDWRHMAGYWASLGAHDTSDAITEYERRFADICEVEHGISFGAGRMALYAILEALDIGEGDEVIIPAFTCVVVPNAIMYRGGRPVYVDIEARTFNIDVNKVEAAITPRTKALYAQHTFGMPCDVDALCDMGSRHGLPVIEDGAHALGAKYKGRSVGSLTEVAFFSTDHSKVINTHLGGMAVTNDDSLASRLKKIQADVPFLDNKTMRRMYRAFMIEYICFSPSILWIGQPIYSVLARLGLFNFFDDELQTRKPESYPYPCRISPAQARIGLSQLELLPLNLAHRRKIASWLENKVGWFNMNEEEIMKSTWLRYSFLVADRAKFEAAFSGRFDLAIWFNSVVNGRKEDLPAVGYRPGSCPLAEHVVRHIVNLPTHSKIPFSMIKQAVNENWQQFSRDIMKDQ